jgi:hypothetical protein
MTRVWAGECVDFVKFVSGTSNTATTSWNKGPSAVQSNGKAAYPAAGVAFATFTNGRYDSGHAFVFLRRVDDYTFEVVDQNWITGAYNAMAVGKHMIRVGGSTRVSNLKNYYIIQK